MKLSHAIILIALLTGQYASLANASTSANVICQFDRSTMIKQKLKKAQECINNGNFSGAKNYLNGVLKLDPNNAITEESQLLHQEAIALVRTLIIVPEAIQRVQ